MYSSSRRVSTHWTIRPAPQAMIPINQGFISIHWFQLRFDATRFDLLFMTRTSAETTTHCRHKHTQACHPIVRHHGALFETSNVSYLHSTTHSSLSVSSDLTHSSLLAKSWQKWATETYAHDTHRPEMMHSDTRHRRYVLYSTRTVATTGSALRARHRISTMHQLLLPTRLAR